MATGLPSLQLPYSRLMMELIPFPPGLEPTFSTEAASTPGVSVSVPPGLEHPFNAEAPVFIPAASLSVAPSPRDSEHSFNVEAPVFVPGVSGGAVPLPPGLEKPLSVEAPVFMPSELTFSAEAPVFIPGLSEYELCASFDMIDQQLPMDYNELSFHYDSQVPQVMVWEMSRL